MPIMDWMPHSSQWPLTPRLTLMFRLCSSQSESKSHVFLALMHALPDCVFILSSDKDHRKFAEKSLLNRSVWTELFYFGVILWHKLHSLFQVIQRTSQLKVSNSHVLIFIHSFLQYLKLMHTWTRETTDVIFSNVIVFTNFSNVSP